MKINTIICKKLATTVLTEIIDTSLGRNKYAQVRETAPKSKIEENGMI